ncbi:MAG: alcohol dehydrogenase [Acidobacteria bacterium 13_2_20CM_57_17]|nr:MAG: alcohol dehydrogenase [Acidobacteria bacterium 13_2_20CM_57_17]
MKAIVYSNYGSPDVLKCEEIEKPVPKDNEVLIRVRAASLNPVDGHLMRGPLPLRPMTGLRKPRNARLGVDVAGQVETVGRNVTQFKPGNEVFGACRAALAEYACASESRLAMKPNKVTFEQAASVPVAGLTALQGLRDKGKIQAGQKVLINGASGGVGTFAVQIAKSFGADVTGVCSTPNVAMVRSIGADRVIDYTKEDFTQSAQRYDLIFDNVSNHSFSERRRILSSNGICVLAGIGGAGSHEGQWARLGGSLKALVASWFVSQKFVTFIARITREDLTILSDLMESGKVTPVIDKRYGLNEVPQALRYLEEGHAQGKVVITVEDDNYA